MSQLTPEISADVVAACTAGAAEIAAALGRVVDATATVEVGAAGTFAESEVPADWKGPGLVIAMIVGGESAIAVLSEASALLPDWYKNPDATGESRLMTLAQEFGMLLLPEALMPSDSKAGRVGNISQSFLRGSTSWPLSYVPLTVSVGDKQGVLYVAWPIGKTAELFDPATSGGASEESHDEASYAPVFDGEDRFDALPAYARSLLRIDLTVRVALAQKRQRADDILGIGPGQIIQFNKSCDEMLDLMVGHQKVARGEAVKVGDKFGLRITSIVLPEERFHPVGG
jgi:flagellar motor switch/type III secretory pathway protein FliN